MRLADLFPERNLDRLPISKIRRPVSESALDRYLGMAPRRPAANYTKEGVIAAYRKQVEAHGGKVLAEQKFVAATRISVYIWRGKYWKSWSEFQAAAGFQPNPRTEKIPEETLLRKLAELALKLEKLPTHLEMRLYRRQDRTFPDEHIYDRIGPADVVRARLGAFCEGKPEFAAVARMLEERRAQYVARQRGDRGRYQGLVYLVRPTEGFFYELRRFRGHGKRLQHESARVGSLPGSIHVIDTDDPEGVERYWRERFKSRRWKRRDAYCLSPDDLIAFRRRKYQ